ncbi:MAG: antitoxin Xre/MbcA/ParS toxin-binding domain-containing protein [Pseudomonadota bacterium]
MKDLSDDLYSDLSERALKRLRRILRSQRQIDNLLDLHEAIDRGFALPPLENHRWLSAFFGQIVAFERGSSSPYGASSGVSKKRLSSRLSGRIYELALAFEAAFDALGSEEAVIDFFRRPSTALNRRKPIDLMSTPPGADLVKTHIERMRYGVYT